LGRDVLGIFSNTILDAGQEPPRATEPAFLRQITLPRDVLDDPIQQFERALGEMGLAVRLEGEIRRSGTPPSIGDTTARFARRSRDALADWCIAVAAFQQNDCYDRASVSDAVGDGKVLHDSVTDGLDVALGTNAARLRGPTLRPPNDLMAAPPLQLSRGIRGVSVLIGSVDPDFHRPEALNEITLIVDRGGDDCYDFLGLAPGAVLIAVDHVVDGSYVGAHRCERKIWVSGSFLFGISNEHAIDEPGTVFLLLHSIEHERCSEIQSDKKDFLDRLATDDQQPTILDTTWPINGSI
jgi:hypothetical protein